jgi:hypothetical protein
MASEMVLAYGDHGLELTPVKDVVEIGVLPVGPGNMAVPASLRFLRRPGEQVPTKLRRILKPRTRLNKSAFPHIEFDCTPFQRYMTDAGPVMGHWSSCHLRGLVDATDPLWQMLSQRDKHRLLIAVTHPKQGGTH